MLLLEMRDMLFYRNMCGLGYDKKNIWKKLFYVDIKLKDFVLR